MSSADNSTDHVSDLAIDLSLQGELSEADMRAVHAHLDECRECRERYETATADATHFRKHVLPRTLEYVTGSLGGSPASAGRPLARRVVSGIIASAAVAATALLLVHRQQGAEDGPIRLLRKGGPGLVVFTKHKEHISRVTDGTHLEPGDMLRFQAEPSDAPYLMVASIDGANHASIYVPYNGKASLRIPAERTFLDDGSIALDGAPGPERIFALFSKQPLDARVVTSALTSVGARGYVAIRSTARLDIPDAFQVSLCIEK